MSAQSRAIAISSGLGLALGFNLAAIGAIAVTIEDAYGVSLATVGLMTTAVSLTHALAQVPSGKVVDRFGAKRIGVVGLVVVLAANALALVGPDAWLALGARALTGIGTALAFVAASIYVRDIGAVAQGWFGGAGLGGAGLPLIVLPSLAAVAGWRAAFLVPIALAAAALVALVLGPPGPAPGRGARAGAVRAAAGPFRDAAVYRLASIHMAGMGLSIVVAAWVTTLLQRAGDYSASTAGLVGSLVLVLGVITRPLGGVIYRRRPARMRPALAVGVVVCTFGTLLLALAGPVALSVLATFLIGLAAGIPFAAAFTGAAVRHPLRAGTAVGLVNMLGNSVVVVGAPLLGLAFSLPGDGRLGFVVIAGLWLASLLVLPSQRDLGLERPREAIVPTPRTVESA